jgi:hypothetical protein
MALLTFEQQNAIVRINSNNQSDYTELERNTENLELKKLLGRALLQDLQDNPDTSENVLLLDGGTYTDCNGNTVKHKGLRYVLAFMVYAAYIKKIPFKDTNTGFKLMESGNSERISRGERDDLIADNRTFALDEWEAVRSFLNENCDNYPLWNSSNERKVYTPRIIPVRSTVYPNSTRNYTNKNKR